MNASPALKLSEVKNDLKKIGCKLKSQLDGSWAIHEPRGVRVVVPSLEAVQEYYRARSVTPAHTAEQTAEASVPAPAPEAARPLPARMEAGGQDPSVTAATPVVAPAASPATRPAPPPKVEISEAQQQAVAAANRVLKGLRENRLLQGRNFLASELAGLLNEQGCPAPLLEKTVNYATAKLQKACIDRQLVKIAFRNAAGQADVMYFDARYASLLKTG